MARRAERRSSIGPCRRAGDTGFRWRRLHHPGGEPVSLDGIVQAGGAIAWGGILSIGVAYTLQVIAQRDAKASHAAIIYSRRAGYAI